MTDLARPVDRRTLYFGPLGLGGPMSPAASERLLQQEMDALTLGDAVPEEVRGQFEKLKTLCLTGLFAYESFTHAEG